MRVSQTASLLKNNLKLSSIYGRWSFFLRVVFTKRIPAKTFRLSARNLLYYKINQAFLINDRGLIPVHPDYTTLGAS